jgi:chorismate mutase
VKEILKKPSSCNDKDEIRDQIDQIDREILSLFALRFQYVKEIVKYKTDEKSVVAQDRKDHVIEERGKWAENLGLSRNTYQEIFRILIDHNINKELELLNDLKKNNKPKQNV